MKKSRFMTPQDNFIYLMYALILLLLSTAIAQQFFEVSAQRLVQSTTVVTLLLGVWGVKSEMIWLTRAALFPIIIIMTSAASYWLEIANLKYTHLFIMLIFFVGTAIQTTKQVLSTGEINRNKIIGAVCLYLLMGLIWALLYTLSSLYFTGAFNGIKTMPEWYLVFPEFIYFSFVTLTTLGYGDITPTVPVTRFLVYMQAVFGQFYLAILVASLVSSHMSGKYNHEYDKK